MAIQILDSRTAREQRRATDRTVRHHFGIYGREHHIDIPILKGEIADRPVFPSAPERGFLRRFLGPQNIAMQHSEYRVKLRMTIQRGMREAEADRNTDSGQIGRAHV